MKDFELFYIAVVGGIGVIAWIFSDAAFRARVKRLERKVELLSKHLNVSLEEIARKEASEILAANPDKFKAIAAYRDATGVNMSEAKAVIESLKKPAS